MNIQAISKFESLLDRVVKSSQITKKPYAVMRVLGQGQELELEESAQWKLEANAKASFYVNDGPKGPVFNLLAPREASKNLIPDSLYSHFRDLAGSVYPQFLDSKVGGLVVEFVGTTEDEELGALVGIGLASYRFKNYLTKKSELAHLSLRKDSGSLDAKVIKRAQDLAQGTNLARHLVNLPPQDLNPKTYAQLAQAYFKADKDVQVEVWEEARLKKEKMGLLLAIGQSASESPRLVRIKYRPKGAKIKEPCVFVGKGITFDSGGLDIKPSQFMRLMKKDMGGSASVMGLASSVIRSGLKLNCDFYLALAENAVDNKSARPGDIYFAKNGISVEIHNTDAEGRLALADALTVATEQKEKPRFLVDFATLTGAMKVGLGSELAGYFSTNSEISNKVREASQKTGDLTWEMPLFEGYDSMLNSAFADCVNSADGYGGAITAALFLKKFVGEFDWLHFDIYAWNDRPKKALQSVGGNGQLVQLWTQILSDLEAEATPTKQAKKKKA